MGTNFRLGLVVLLIAIKDFSCFGENITSAESFSGEISVTRNQTSHYSRPDSLRSPLQTESRLLVSGGATNPYNRSFDSLKLPMMGMMEDPTIKILFDIQDGIRYVLQTNNDYTFAYHGTGTTGMSGTLDNMIEPGDKVLVGIIGVWGNVATKIAQRLGGNVVRMEKPAGQRFSLIEIEAGLHRHRPNILFLVSGESSTGVYQPMEGVGQLCHKYNCITIIDVIATVGQQPIKMDENKIDVVYLNSQKGCGGIVGLSPVSYSPRAMRKVKRRRTFPKIYQTDANEQADAWFITKPVEARHEAYAHSLSVSLLYSLREGLARVVEEGIENVWERHADAHRYLQFRAAKLGLEPFVPNPEDRLIGTAIFKAPQGKDGYKIESYMLEKFGIEISPGLFISVGKLIRIGLFGSNANREVVSRVMDALEIALNSTQTNS